VAVFVKKNSEGIGEATLDGVPALVMFMNEGADGNAPWNFGHELIEAWEKAKKLVGNQSAADLSFARSFSTSVCKWSTRKAAPGIPVSHVGHAGSMMHSLPRKRVCHRTFRNHRHSVHQHEAHTRRKLVRFRESNIRIRPLTGRSLPSCRPKPAAVIAPSPHPVLACRNRRIGERPVSFGGNAIP
jgi:hypothetical protein